jgi:hypothetical protein
MIGFYCHQNSYGKTMEHRCPIYIMTMMHLLGFKGAWGSKVGRVSIFFFFSFHFLCKRIVLQFLLLWNLVEIFGLQIKCVFLWCLLHALLGVCFYNFLHVRKLKGEGKREEQVFCKEEDQENNYRSSPLCPFLSFSLFPSLPMLFSKTILSRNNFYTQGSFKSQTMINIHKVSELLEGCCQTHCYL